ncbi:hypothetical protein V5P93_005197 [Actinokineospora auranticolor]|uniref:hypothetical protein n=1 Tax=Actinokineospora auranticolor TaxID=155976 RepID=UPI0011B038F1|nr:hypothetical protein [Actinokineospora auranticolor]
MEPILDRLKDVDLPSDFSFDFTVVSPARLEVMLGERDDQGFGEGVVAYVGESLIRAGNGDWDWDEIDEVPVVSSDEVLGLPLIDPGALLGWARVTGSGTVFADAIGGLADVVAAYRAAHPKWTPRRSPDDIDVHSFIRHEWLVAWLAERVAGFHAWVSALGVDAAWLDFGLDSLDRVEALLCAEFGTRDEFKARQDGDLVQGAAWYVGEVACRDLRAAWLYHEDPLGYEVSGDAWAGTPYVSQNGRDGASASPLAALRVAVRDRVPRTLRGRFSHFK